MLVLCISVLLLAGSGFCCKLPTTKVVPDRWSDVVSCNVAAHRQHPNCYQAVHECLIVTQEHVHSRVVVMATTFTSTKAEQ